MVNEVMMPMQSVLGQVSKKDFQSSNNSGPAFSDFLKEPMQSAEKGAIAQLSGAPNVDLESVVMAIEEADVKLKLAKSALEKGAGAFKEVLGMQL